MAQIIKFFAGCSCCCRLRARFAVRSSTTCSSRAGMLIDPRNKISAVRDVAIAGGRVAAVGANIDPTPRPR